MIVSPLVTLMKDQVSSCSSGGLAGFVGTDLIGHCTRRQIRLWLLRKKLSLLDVVYSIYWNYTDLGKASLAFSKTLLRILTLSRILRISRLHNTDCANLRNVWNMHVHMYIHVHVCTYVHCIYVYMYVLQEVDERFLLVFNDDFVILAVGRSLSGYEMKVHVQCIYMYICFCMYICTCTYR